MSDETPTPVDGITQANQPSNPPSAPGPKEKHKEQKQMVARMKFVILLFMGIPYLGYCMWSIFLLTVLPDPTGQWDYLIPYGKLSSMMVAGACILLVMFAFMRIGKAGKAADSVRYMGFVRTALFVIPAVALSGLVPYMIVQEPPLFLYIASPEEGGTGLVAPLAVTFSAEEAKQILRLKKLRTVSFSWDFNGDGVTDEQTVLPTATAYYERSGSNNISVTIKLSNGEKRIVRKRMLIPNAVFSYYPVQPVIDESVRFSVAHLVDDGEKVEEIKWDFNDDNIPDQQGTNLEVDHTFLRIGEQRVSVAIIVTNKTGQKRQRTYNRTLLINEPKPLPFDVTIDTNPTFLESPPPFQVIFSINTQEDLQSVDWDFGDGQQAEGPRVPHTFKQRGVFKVTARVRNTDGEIAKVSKQVKIVNTLKIDDLSFDSNLDFSGNNLIAEAPVTIELTPKTGRQLITFMWDAPDASQSTVEEDTIKATYREEGNYKLVLIAQDAEGSVLRREIPVTIKPRADFVTFDMSPPTGVAPLEVEFDASETFIPNEQITGFIWHFGDTPQQNERRDSARVSHIFTQPGTYTVKLTAYTTSGKSVETTRTIVVRAPFLDACFTMSRSEGEAPLPVLFSRTCSTGNPTKVLWDFGDGWQSDDMGETVDHVFEDKGKKYTVELRLENDSGIVNTARKTITTY